MSAQGLPVAGIPSREPRNFFDISRKFYPHLCSDYDEDTKTCSIEGFIEGKEPFRIVADGHEQFLFPRGRLPVLHGHRVSNFLQRYEEEMEMILHKYNPGWSLRDNKYYPAHEPEKIRDTLTIMTWNMDTRKWKEAANELQQFLVSVGAGEIAVEVEYTDMLYSDESEIFRPFKTWEESEAIERVRGKVYKIADDYLEGDLVAITFWMRGDAFMNPTVPTAMIHIRRGSVHPYEHIQALLEDVINAERELSGAYIRLELLPGSLKLAGAPRVEIGGELGHDDSVRVGVGRGRSHMRDGLLETIHNGSSIGVMNKFSTGSLGGWVELKKGDEPSLKGFLTTFSNIENGDSANRARNRCSGIGLRSSTSSSKIPITHPSLLDWQEAKSRSCDLVEQVHSGPSLYLGALLEIAFQKCSDKPKQIGAVKLASGYGRTFNRRSMDWAFVESSVDAEIQINAVPPIQRCLSENADNTVLWGQHYSSQRTGLISDKIGSLQPDSTKSVAELTLLRNTSAAKRNFVPAKIWWRGRQDPTMEVTVLAVGSDSTDAEDIGKWYFNNKNEAVGMLIGFIEGAGLRSIAIVTPIEDIVKDIEAQTGYTVELPKLRGGAECPKHLKNNYKPYR